MRIARVQTSTGIHHARADDAGWVPVSDPYAAFATGAQPHDLGDTVTGSLLPSTAPLVVVGIAQNGYGHPSPVQAWLKSPRSVVAAGTPVRLRRDAGTTVAEAEVAVVIGCDTSGLTAATAHEYVLGVTAVNDLSSPDRSRVDPRNFEAKAGDGYTPVGDVIDTDIDIDDVPLTLRVDGAVVAETSSAALPVSIRECLAYVATWVRLGPGDLVMTGAPHSSAEVSAGSTVEVLSAGSRLLMPTH